MTSLDSPALSLPLRTPRNRRPNQAVRPREEGDRFTLDGDAQLEAHLARTCDRIAAGIGGLLPRSRLEGLLLGGGYGRGEGGVWRSANGDQPYNDLEFYVFLRGNRHLNERRHGRALHVLGEILTPQAGVEVEFKVTSRAELAAAPVTMFSYDLVTRHRRLIGGDGLLETCGHHRAAERIPLAEATRLMMNRCTGLLLSRERLNRAVFAAGDADFVGRNIAKAQLGAGDAVLTAIGQYHWSARDRHANLARLGGEGFPEWRGRLESHHADGVAFKLHPRRSSETRDELLARHESVTGLCREVWLWLESRRLERRFASVVEYATPEFPKGADALVPRNLLVNLKVLGPRGLALGPLRHPRERILTSLPLLLWHPETLRSPALLCRIQRELQTDARDFGPLVASYARIWSQVN
ncbi:MAG TPA: hypothetical protein VHE61_23520 [Opitutaceae bacterium]|nr:hypothetical protein [Opitutaceae bacterium]